MVTALLVAGRRPGVDPLAAHFGVVDKALIPVGGEPMLSRVTRVLLDHPQIEKVVVLAQDSDHLFAAIPWMLDHPRIKGLAGGDSVSGAVAHAVRTLSNDMPFLLTTADNALLNQSILNVFFDEVEGGPDVAVGMVESRILLQSYPASRRTWLKFRGGRWSGANLFWLGGPAILPVLDFWQGIEQQRKKGRAIIGAFGLPMLIAVGLRLLTAQQAVVRAGARFGVRAKLVSLPVAEACIDVDSVADKALAEEILARNPV